MKTWIREKSLSYAPNTNIILGRLWTDKNDPGSYVGLPVDTSKEVINTTTKSVWKSAEGSNIRAFIGIWIQFLQSIPLLARLFVGWDGKDDRVFQFQELKTVSFEPSPDYVVRSVKAVEKEVLDKGHSVYMVTGVRIARGAQGVATAKKNIVGEGSMSIQGIDGGTIAGPRMGLERGTYKSESFEDSTDFIFAYRLRKIFCEKGVVKSKPVAGELHAKELASSSTNADERDRGGELTIVDAKLGAADVTISGEKIIFVDDDDGEESMLII